MTEERKTDKTFLEQFLNKFVEVILVNEMHYTGIVLSVGEDHLKLRDKFEKIVFIPLNNICSVVVMR